MCAPIPRQTRPTTDRNQPQTRFSAGRKLTPFWPPVRRPAFPAMPSLRNPGALYALFGLLGLMDYAMVMGQQNPVQTCPPVADIAPCACNVKKNGLDILCEATDINHINRAMSTLKGKNPIIFYLKLRHNTLPKLQGFVFLALDIRHLTIHNSSLAVIEETALSSLGECGEWGWMGGGVLIGLFDIFSRIYFMLYIEMYAIIF